MAGERARRGIPAFRHSPAAKVALSSDEEAWIRGPKKFKRERRRFDTDDLEVVRRPARGDSDDIPSGPGAARSTAAPGVGPPTAKEWTPPSPDDGGRGAPRRSPFADEREQRQRELAMLTQPSLRNRDARQRIVRSDASLRPADPVAEARRVRGPNRPAAPGWRESQTSAEEIEAAAGLGVPPVAPPVPSVAPTALPRPPGPARAVPSAAAAERPALPRGLPPAKPAAPALQRWALHVDGADTGWTVQAADIADAAAEFQREVPELIAGNTSIVCLGKA